MEGGAGAEARGQDGEMSVERVLFGDLEADLRMLPRIHGRKEARFGLKPTPTVSFGG